MTLTKLQITALCLAFAVLPLGYEWRAVYQARQAGEQMRQQLGTIEADALAREQDQARAERQATDQENRFAQTVPASSVVANLAAPRPSGNQYVWDENSPYVRVPRQLLSQMRFAPFATRVARDGKTERYQLPPLGGDGSPQPALEAALGLSVEEAERLQQVCQAGFAQFFDAAASHSELKSEPLGNNTTLKLKTAAFPEEGTQLRDQFKRELVGVLGAERADAFWQQSAPVFTGLLNDFGAYPRELQLIRNDQAGMLELLNSYRNSTSIGSLDQQRNGLPLPPALQAYADTWSREMAAARSAAQAQ